MGVTPPLAALRMGVIPIVPSICPHDTMARVMGIKRLPALLINQIAAGEVIERPASVVKELVENSLDAAAQRIDIVVEEGGRQLIRVSDDGTGIPEEELPLALASHATSKLESAEQLSHIHTMGFRGEALASIASVSRLRVTSRATVDGRVAESAATIEAAGDEVTGPMPAAGAPGTVIEVRDLFFNTPARRKFMRGAAIEMGHISEVVSRIAMAHPHVSFTLTHNDRKSLDAPALSGTNAQRLRCVQILGPELDEALLEFSFEDPTAEDGAVVWGLAGHPSIARATAKFQYICLNGRPIRDRGIAHAIKEAYRGLIPPDRHPVVVLFLQLDPGAVDVNVHPAKAEVRFHEPSRVHGLVLHALRQRLLGTDLTAKATLPTSGFELRACVPEPEPMLEFAAARASHDAAAAEPITAASNGSTTVPPVPPPEAIVSASAFVDYFRRMDPRQKGFVYQEVKRAIEAEQPEILRQVESADTSVSRAEGHGTQQDGRVSPLLRSHGVLQVHKSYLVTQDEQGILIVDQHALHERVMFEELRQRVMANNLESQRMLMPAVLQASPKRIAMLEPLKPLLEKIGIEAEPFGENAMAIHAFPTFLFDRRVEPESFMESLLDRVEEGEIDPATFATSQTAFESALHDVLDMMSCKAAVKAGDQLSDAELAALLARREEIERASNCPHGRPTTIRLTLRELEKQFKRA